MREIILDTETTGLDPKLGHRIIEIGCVEIFNRIRTGRFFQVYLNPERNVPMDAFRIHGISTEFLLDKKKFHEIVDEFLDFTGDSKLIMHNAKFDLKFLNHELDKIGFRGFHPDQVIDTLTMARRKFPGSPASLDALCKRFRVDTSKRDKHGALLDAELLADVYLNMVGGGFVLDEEQPFENYKSNLYKDPRELSSLNKVARPARKFTISEEEKTAHEDIISKLKKPLWVES